MFAISRQLQLSPRFTLAVRPLFWSGFLASLYFATTPHTPAIIKGLWDKGEHMTGFAVLSALAALAWPTVSLLRLTERLALFGAMIELLQSVPSVHRSCDIFDWIADMTATCLVLGAFALVRRA
jgi:hypothetical protein